MGKGLPRSHSRGPGHAQEVVKLTIPLEDLTAIITDPGAAVGWGTAVISGLHEGNLLILGAVLTIDTLTKGDADITDTFDGDFAVGTAPSTDNTALTGVLGDIVPTGALAQGVAGVSSANKGQSTVTEQVIFDNTAAAAELNLNLLVDDTSISAASSLIAVGMLTIAYVVLGDD